MDKELFPEPIARPAGPILTGRVVRLMEGYAREVRVGRPVLLAVLMAAGVSRALILLVGMMLPFGAGNSPARRTWKQLRKGPEFLVTPLRVRDRHRMLCEMEIHGHLPQSAIEPADHVQITLRAQNDKDLPARVERIVNLTTGQSLTPRPATIWSHLGPALLVQAVLGLSIVGATAACVVVG